MVEISLDLVKISSDLACFCKIWSDFLQLQLGSGCSGFGDANPPLDSPASGFEKGNSLPTDWTFGSSRNRVGIGQFGWVVELQLGLDSPTLQSNTIQNEQEVGS